ncbi:MAG: hypothetical protein QGG40_04000 [Myxococcota bacterium]|nr:hypothetical protein [Myxococcota bacterium]
MRYHSEIQHRLRRQDAWLDFTATEGRGWLARFDERTGTPHRAWGPGIDLGPLPSPDRVEAALRALFQRHESMVGTSSQNLRLGAATYVERTDTWYVRFDRIVRSVTGLEVPVWRSGIEARIRHGRLILLGVDTYPLADAVSLEPRVDVASARKLAVDGGLAPDSDHVEGEARLVLLPREERGTIDLTLCWEIRSETTTPRGKWVSFIDARDGAVLATHNEVRFMEGQILGLHDLRTVDGETELSAIAHTRVEGASESSFTDEEGYWELADDEGIASFTGPYLRVRNRDGDDGELEVSDELTVWTEEDATQAEIDSFVFLSQVREWGLTYAPEVSYLDDRLTSNVNLSGECNAYYDGSVNFYQATGGCNNTGRIADVNYHEWGHGFHYYNLESGTWDGSISEGISDSIAFLMTGDPIIGPYFYTNGSGIREVETDRVYPDDWVDEVHYDGLIFAGAIWDLWGALEEDLGEDEAYEVLNQLFVDALKAGPEIPDAYDEFVAADDDNGDLSDGTPHLCAIIDAFFAHGLGPGGNSALVSLSHEPLGNQNSGGSGYELEADLVEWADSCTQFDEAGASVVYTTDGGESWDAASLQVDEGGVWGTIPSQEFGTIVHYYLRIEGEDGSEVTLPDGAEINPFSFFVGGLEEIQCEDFEDSDGGYTHELLDGDDEEGADDWMWGTPIGLGGDPDYAYSGDSVWGNDLGGERYNGEYQNGKWNRLTSASIDVESSETVIVQFRRWLTVEDGYYDQASVLANGDTVWTNHATEYAIGDEHHEDAQWALHTLSIPMQDAEALELSWDIQSDQGLTLGGWNIDDVCVYRPVDDSVTDEDQSGDDNEGWGKLSGCGCGQVGTYRSLNRVWFLALTLMLLRRRTT